MSKTVRPFNSSTTDTIPDPPEALGLRRHLLSIVGGLVVGSTLLLLTYLQVIRLCGPFRPMFLKMFHQRLEFQIRYLALTALCPAIHALVLQGLRLKGSDLCQTLERPFVDSSQDLLLSVSAQLVLTANLSAEMTLVFGPFLAVSFFFGSLLSPFLAIYAEDDYLFGRVLTLIPSLVAVVVNGLGVVRMLFM